MGLMYVFPVSEEETDFVKLELSPTGKGSKITLKSYGLPYIFWGYALGAMTRAAASMSFFWRIFEMLRKLDQQKKASTTKKPTEMKII
jgi:hypothetical protein